MKKLTLISVALIVLATTVFSQSNCRTMETKYKTTISINPKDSSVKTINSTDPQLFSIVEYKADFLITILSKTTLKYRSYYCEYIDGELDGTAYLSSRSTKKQYSIHIYPNAVLIWDRDKNVKTWYYNDKIPKWTF